MKFLVLIVLIALIISYYIYVSIKFVEIKSSIDSNYYLVQRYPNPQESSDTLATIYNKLDILRIYILNHSSIQDSIKFKEYIDRFNIKLDRNLITEAMMEDSVTSYSINKSQIFLCIRNKPDLQLTDTNTLMYVVLHELTHILANGIVSTPGEHSTNIEFKELFQFLLVSASNAGIYIPVNYSGNIPYCGINV